MQDVLLLNADFSPVRILDWRRAVCLLMADKARLVAGYEGMEIRSQHLSVPWPAVVTLTQYVGHRGRVRFNRQNVLARDNWTCQYCDWAPRTSEGRPVRTDLTMDHVIPRARAVNGRVRLAEGRVVPVTSWENIVTACRPCNQRKADRLPEEVRMTLRAKPRRPSPFEGVGLVFARVAVPDEWRDWLPEGVAA
jgi:5-methylcytosine-specific restriction endonuclease McrA